MLYLNTIGLCRLTSDLLRFVINGTDNDEISASSVSIILLVVFSNDSLAIEHSVKSFSKLKTPSTKLFLEVC